MSQFPVHRPEGQGGRELFVLKQLMCFAYVVFRGAKMTSKRVLSFVRIPSEALDALSYICMHHES